MLKENDFGTVPFRPSFHHTFHRWKGVPTSAPARVECTTRNGACRIKTKKNKKRWFQKATLNFHFFRSSFIFDQINWTFYFCAQFTWQFLQVWDTVFHVWNKTEHSPLWAMSLALKISKGNRLNVRRCRGGRWVRREIRQMGEPARPPLWNVKGKFTWICMTCNSLQKQDSVTCDGHLFLCAVHVTIAAGLRHFFSPGEHNRAFALLPHFFLMNATRCSTAKKTCANSSLHHPAARSSCAMPGEGLWALLEYDGTRANQHLASTRLPVLLKFRNTNQM